MTTSHVISEYLELRFRIDCRLIIYKDVVIALKSIGLLGDPINKDPSIENAGRTIGIYSLIILMTLTIRLCMMYKRIMVYMLLTFNDGNAFHRGIYIFSILVIM